MVLFCLALLAPPAAATPTVEEQALRAALEGRSSAVIAILEQTGDPQLRWLAGRYALLTQDRRAAARLLSGDDLRSAWGRIDLAVTRGDTTAAAADALVHMDAALAGTHRDALAAMLVGWGAARRATDPANAATFLHAAIGLAPSETVRRTAEDALFRLSPELGGDGALAAARRRLLTDPASAPARLRAAIGLERSAPTTAAAWLIELMHSTDHDDATAAARRLQAMPLPDPLVLGALAELGARFPDDEAIAQLRLASAKVVVERDEATGAAALAALEGVPTTVSPTVAIEAREARARATQAPEARRDLWLAIAEREGATARGDRARAEALAALLQAAEEKPAGEDRRVFAASALGSPDGAGVALLRYYALPEDAGRTDALWVLANDFGDGAWCGELAATLLQGGVDRPTSERFAGTCGSEDGDAGLLVAHAQGTATLRLTPRAGGLDVTAAAATHLSVSQHRVDPEALFRASVGHPLDNALDASLLEPDLAWEVPLPDGTLETTPIHPRGGGPLVALTVRAGDQRATALVIAEPLTVQIVRQADDVAIGVLRDGAPVAGVELLVQDDAGTVRRVRTDRGGVALLHAAPLGTRVLARKGSALGFATSSAGGEAAVPVETWSLAVWDRAVPAEGAVVDVEVFGGRDGVTEGTRTLRIQGVSASQTVLSEATVTIEHGAGHARIFTMGEGGLVLLDGERRLTATTVRSAATARPPVRVTFTPAVARIGETVVAHVTPVVPLGPDGLAGAVTIHTAWGETTAPLVLTNEGVDLPIDLSPADEGAWVSFSVPDGRSWAGGVAVDAPPPAPPPTGLPSVVGRDQPFPVEAPADAWIRATAGSGAVRWTRAGEPVRLPQAGTWTLCLWRDRCSAEVPIVVAAGMLDPAGRWTGEPVLVATMAEGIRSARIVRAGDPLTVADTRGASDAWSVVADDAATVVPVRGAAPVEIQVAGTLTRGGTSLLVLGRGLPEGTRIWAFLRDSPDRRRRGRIDVPDAWVGAAGNIQDPWAPEARWGEAIAAGLLAEEERLAEATDVERVDFGFSAAAELASGASGYGAGAGAFGSRGEGGLGSVGGDPIILGGIDRSPLAGDPRAIAVLDGGPGAWSVAIPQWIAGAELEIVARTPDGRWGTYREWLDVGGGRVTALPSPATVPATWEGPLSSLLPIAQALPVEARVHALTALAKAGLAEAEAPRRATWALRPTGPDAVLARTLRGEVGAPSSSATEAIPDVRQAERAIAALTIAGTDPDRARAAATRLAQVPSLDPWIRTRVGLALWVAGARREALDVLVGDDAGLAAARAVVSGTAEAGYVGDWWATARSAGANPSDRALAIDALTLVRGGGGVAPPATRARTLVGSVQAPLAEWRGETFPRGTFGTDADEIPLVGTVPRGRAVPVRVTLPDSIVPTRVACPDAERVHADQPWIDVPPTPVTHMVECLVRIDAEGPRDLQVTWFGPQGDVRGSNTWTVEVGPPQDTRPDDPLSPRERLGLGLRLAPSGDATGLALLEGLAGSADLPAAQIGEVYRALLIGRRNAHTPEPLIAALQAYREHLPDGELELETAAAVAHAYAATGDAPRALAAAKVVMDARFKEELGAVSQLQASGLALTSLKLMRELLERYPEGPTVVTGRYLAPTMLLNRAEGAGDRLGYTRSSLRHTAAADLAAFLLLHPDAPEAPEAAALLSDVLHVLGDASREQALSGLLARRYHDGDAAWRLALAQARTTLAAGRPAEAARLLDGVPVTADPSLVQLERGRVMEALGRLDAAREAYRRSGSAEAQARLAWLERTNLELPGMIVQTPGAPAVVRADLLPGAEVTVTAIRVLLEAVLLRDAGVLDPTALNVAGLRPAATRTYTIGADGDIPLPVLSDGAYVVTVTTAGTSGRLVVLQTDAELSVVGQPGTGTLVHLSDTRGSPLAGARLWLFAGGGEVDTTHTDGRGAAWVPYGSGEIGVLARLGERYAVANLDPTSWRDQAPTYSSGAPAYGAVLHENEAAYNRLFEQDTEQRVPAAGL